MDKERYKRRTKRKNEEETEEKRNKRKQKFHETVEGRGKKKKKSLGTVYMRAKVASSTMKKGIEREKHTSRICTGNEGRKNEELESTRENAFMKQKRKVEEKRKKE